MRLALNISSIIVLLLTASCRSPDALLPESRAALEKQQEQQRLIEAFRARYAAYRLPVGSPVPRNVRSIKQVAERNDLGKLGSLRFELVLGDRWAYGRSSIYRTESRYRLVDEAGKIVASAESTVANSDVGGDEIRITYCVDSGSRAAFIFEEVGWSVERAIVFQKGADEAWTTRYVRLPKRHDGVDFSIDPKIIGAESGRLYFEYDDLRYAIPLDQLEDESGGLEYPVG